MSKDTETSKAPRGQKLVETFGKDTASMGVNENEARHGRSMGGGTDNLAHSLTGASAVQHVKGKEGKV